MVTPVQAELKQASAEVARLTKELVAGAVMLATRAIVEGDAIAGTQGQPHDLREGQWTTVAESEWVTLISTDDKSARSVEDAISYAHGGPITLNSPIGGSHSVKKTVLHWDKIVVASASGLAQ